MDQQPIVVYFPAFQSHRRVEIATSECPYPCRRPNWNSSIHHKRMFAKFHGGVGLSRATLKTYPNKSCHISARLAYWNLVRKNRLRLLDEELSVLIAEAEGLELRNHPLILCDWVQTFATESGGFRWIVEKPLQGNALKFFWFHYCLTFSFSPSDWEPGIEFD